jgi:phage tail tape-measure protein
MAKRNDQNEEISQIASIGAGAALGATVGSVIPVVGTTVGAVVGGMLGGSQIGKAVGSTALGMLGLGGSSNASRPSANETMLQLERLSQMRAQGILTEEEFSAAKAQLLDL